MSLGFSGPDLLKRVPNLAQEVLREAEGSKVSQEEALDKVLARHQLAGPLQRILSGRIRSHLAEGKNGLPVSTAGVNVRDGAAPKGGLGRPTRLAIHNEVTRLRKSLTGGETGTQELCDMLRKAPSEAHRRLILSEVLQFPNGVGLRLLNPLHDVSPLSSILTPSDREIVATTLGELYDAGSLPAESLALLLDRSHHGLMANPEELVGLVRDSGSLGLQAQVTQILLDIAQNPDPAEQNRVFAYWNAVAVVGGASPEAAREVLGQLRGRDMLEQFLDRTRPHAVDTRGDTAQNHAIGDFVAQAGKLSSPDYEFFAQVLERADCSPVVERGLADFVLAQADSKSGASAPWLLEHTLSGMEHLPDTSPAMEHALFSLFDNHSEVILDHFMRPDEQGAGGLGALENRRVLTAFVDRVAFGVSKEDRSKLIERMATEISKRIVASQNYDPGKPEGQRLTREAGFLFGALSQGMRFSVERYQAEVEAYRNTVTELTGFIQQQLPIPGGYIVGRVVDEANEALVDQVVGWITGDDGMTDQDMYEAIEPLRAHLGKGLPDAHSSDFWATALSFWSDSERHYLAQPVARPRTYWSG